MWFLSHQFCNHFMWRGVGGWVGGWVVLKFELRSSHLLGRCSTLKPFSTPPFIVIFWIGSHVYSQASLDLHPPIYAPHVVRMTGVFHHAQLFIGWDGVLWTFCPGWTQTAILHISTSWAVWITGMSQCTQLNSSILTWLQMIHLLFLSLRKSRDKKIPIQFLFIFLKLCT
jgi:hypothetical protein